MTLLSSGAPSVVNAAADLVVNSTNSGTVGAVTINNNSGRYNKVTAASHVFLNLETVDATAKSCIAVAAAGSFTITLNAASTGQVAIDFLVTN